MQLPPLDSHAALDGLTTILIMIVAFFLVRLVKKQDHHSRRLENHAQRLTRIDGDVENA